MIIRCLDLETTGLPPDAAVVESGWCDLQRSDHHEMGKVWSIRIPQSRLVNPGRPIPPEASAVHHIVDADVQGMPAFGQLLNVLRDGAEILAAHHADFERAFFSPRDIPWICTWKLAIRLWPDAPSHKLQVLRYHLGLKVHAEWADPPHRAAGDAYVTARLLKVALAELTVEQALAISAEQAILPRLTFGMHATKRYSEVPASYLEWMLRQQDMDADARATALHELNRRRDAA